MTTINQPAPRLCNVKTPDGIRLCEIVDGPIYDYRLIFQTYVVRAVEGKPLNVINRMVIPEWKLSKVQS